MTPKAPAAEATSPPSIERLTQCYESSLSVTAYHFGDSMAVVRLGGAALVVRPWRWNFTETPPETMGYLGRVPSDMLDRIEAWLSQRQSGSARIELGNLLSWAFFRGPQSERDRLKKDADGSVIDAEYIGRQKFNRLTVREVLQTWVEMGTPASKSMLLETISAHGVPTLRMTCDNAQALVAGLRDGGRQPETGRNPLLLDWGRGAIPAPMASDAFPSTREDRE